MPAPGAEGKAAAFFDVDGTLVQTTIVHYYMYFRSRRMSRWAAAGWRVLYLCKCAYFPILDRISRSRLNVVFYRDYRGLPAAEIKALAQECYRDVIAPRRFAQAEECLETHRRSGRMIVLVSGSVDFILDPLARAWGIQHVVAPSLVEIDGHFSGELDGPPVGEAEKARRIRQFAQAHGIDLAGSHAYGDSIADLPMLEVVGAPHAVNPDGHLAAIARSRGWPIHHWTVAGKREETH